MNDFEKKLIADLASGKSVEALLAEFNTALATAKKAEEERQKKIAEEKRRQEEEARKAKAEKEREAKSKRIVELANRALNNTTTPGDIAWLMNEYVHTNYPKHAEDLNEILTAKDVDDMINLAVKLVDVSDPLLNMFNGSWAKPVNINSTVLFPETKEKNKSKSDDEVISDFINKILH